MPSSNVSFNVSIIIPARLNSTRLHHKVLADIQEKPMIQHVFQNAYNSNLPTYIAYDLKPIFHACSSFTNNLIKTSSSFQNGTHRIASIASSFNSQWFINIQADEPLISTNTISRFLSFILQNQNEHILSVMQPIRYKSIINIPSDVKVIVDNNFYAKNFFRHDNSSLDHKNIFHHVGIYAYSKQFLTAALPKIKSSNIKDCQNLEQSKFLNAGFNIKMLLSSESTIGVDSPSDLRKVRRLFRLRELSTLKKHRQRIID